MVETLHIHCANDGRQYEISRGTSLGELAREVCGSEMLIEADRGGGRKDKIPVLAALVNHKLKELGFRPSQPDEIEFIGYNHPDGRRTYIRSLFFVLQKAIRELYPDLTLIVDYALPSGHYCFLRQGFSEDGAPVAKALGEDDFKAIRQKMQDIIREDIPIVKSKMSSADAIRIFEANGQAEKVRLIKSIGRYTSSVYSIGDTFDTFHGPLLPSTGLLRTFAITGFREGFLLQYPMQGFITKIAPVQKQAKIATTLKKHSDWCSIIGVKGIGTLNSTILAGRAVELINLCEASHEKDYADIAGQVFRQCDRIRIVFIAGPSSSGKTSSSLRLAIQCKVLGMNPKVIELDNYFVDREHTPLDENGNYDFEALGAMDLELLKCQLNDLLAGKTVDIPKFNFKTGTREKGSEMRLGEKDILIMEGIHALNPEMVSGVDNSRIFRVYASALTSLSVDENNNISTSDNRLLRRIVRDNRVRGITPEETILRWDSVRRGENRNIFPYQENADAEFNSALLFELPMLRYYAEPLLRRISPQSAAYTEAIRLLKFLDYIVPLSPEEIAAIPPTSIMREFIGGQTL